MTAKRRYARTPADLVLFDATSGGYESVQTRNVSPGGLYLVLKELPPVGTEIKLAIARREGGSRARSRELLNVTGVVSWHGEDGVGVAFEDPSDAFLAELARLYLA